MSRPTRWATETGPQHSARYLERFRRLALDGHDLAGEARLVDAIVGRGSRILDAGCGSGRVGAELAARGHQVVGVDADRSLVEAARTDHPGPRWLVADLAELDLAAVGEAEPFDAAVVAGNVMVFVAPGTEAAVLSGIARQLRPGGVVITGFALDRGYSIDQHRLDAEGVGLIHEQLFATWDLRPFTDDADFAVAVFRRPV